MAYQNLYFEKEANIMHVWDDQKGYYTKKYRTMPIFRTVMVHFNRYTVRG